MKQETAQSRYAKMLLVRGVSYDEILKDSAMQGFNPATLRTIARRLKQANETKKRNAETNETENETFENGVSTPTTEQAKNTPNNAENAVSPDSETLQAASTLTQFRREFAKTFHPADLIPYGCVSVACVGVSATLPGIGYVVSALYFAVFAVALHYLKVRGEWFDIALMVLLEVFVGFPAHLSWANEALWANVTTLPIEIQLAFGGQQWIGRGIETPFKIAAYAAAVLVLFGAYGVVCSVLANKKG